MSSPMTACSVSSINTINTSTTTAVITAIVSHGCPEPLWVAVVVCVFDFEVESIQLGWRRKNILDKAGSIIWVVNVVFCTNDSCNSFSVRVTYGRIAHFFFYIWRNFDRHVASQNIDHGISTFCANVPRDSARVCTQLPAACACRLHSQVIQPGVQLVASCTAGARETGAHRGRRASSCGWVD